MPDVEPIIEQLRTIEETLRDYAYDALRQRAAGEGSKDAERRFEQARRAVAKAVRVLGAAEDASAG